MDGISSATADATRLHAAVRLMPDASIQDEQVKRRHHRRRTAIQTGFRAFGKSSMSVISVRVDGTRYRTRTAGTDGPRDRTIQTAKLRSVCVQCSSLSPWRLVQHL